MDGPYPINQRYEQNQMVTSWQVRRPLLPLTLAVALVLPKPGGLQTVAMPADRFSMLRPLSFGSPICGP